MTAAAASPGKGKTRGGEPHVILEEMMSQWDKIAIATVTPFSNSLVLISAVPALKACSRAPVHLKHK